MPDEIHPSILGIRQRSVRRWWRDMRLLLSKDRQREGDYLQYNSRNAPSSGLPLQFLHGGKITRKSKRRQGEKKPL